MKSIPILLQSHFDKDAVTTARLLRVLTKSGVLYGFTDSDADIVYNPATVDPEGTGDDWGSANHRADNGFTPERVQQTADLAVDNTDLQGWVSASGISKAMLLAGLFDYAKVRVYRVNWADLTMGHELIAVGTLGITKFSDQGWRTEFRSLTQQLKQPMADLYSISCTKTFGSKPIGTGGEQPEEEYPCMKDWVWVAGTVTSVDVDEPERIFGTDLGEADAWFAPGVIRVLDGPNAGAQMEVDVHEDGGLTLSLPLPAPMTPGINFEIRQDCDKLGRDGDCKNKHDNYINFGGQEDIPVADGGQLMVPGALIRQ